MASFEHEVPAEIRAASRWDEDTACYVAPTGAAWIYTSDPRGDGVDRRDADGQPIIVAVWLKEE
jgi:hypothetical protein